MPTAGPARDWHWQSPGKNRLWIAPGRGKGEAGAARRYGAECWVTTQGPWSRHSGADSQGTAGSEGEEAYCGFLSGQGGWGRGAPALPGTAGSPSSSAGKRGGRGLGGCGGETPRWQRALCERRGGGEGPRGAPRGRGAVPGGPARPRDAPRSLPLITSCRSISFCGRLATSSRLTVCCQFWESSSGSRSESWPCSSSRRWGRKGSTPKPRLGDSMLLGG